MKKLLFTFTALLLFTFSSCSEDSDDGIQPNNQGGTNTPVNNTPVSNFPDKSLTGAIIFPSGSIIQPSNVTILSSTDNSSIKDGEYGLDVSGLFEATFVNNSDGDVVMMGYKYPGGSKDITAKSTVLGLVMMSPIALELSDTGKVSLINEVLNNSLFNLLESQVESKIVAGENLFDENDIAFIDNLKTLFSSSLNKSSFKKEEKELPVQMAFAGRDFVFTNSGKAYTTLIEVYKDDILEDYITVEGVQIVATSLDEIINDKGAITESPVEYKYTLEGDGAFTFKYSTGKPGSLAGNQTNSPFVANVKLFGIGLFKTTTAGIDWNSLVDGCYDEIGTNVYNTVKTLFDTTSDGNVSLGETLVLVKETLLNNAESIIKCSKSKIEEGWFKNLAKNFSFWNTAFGIISNGANTTILGVQWAASYDGIEECFLATGDNVKRGCFPLAGDWLLETMDAEGNPANCFGGIVRVKDYFTINEDGTIKDNIIDDYYLQSCIYPDKFTNVQWGTGGELTTQDGHLLFYIDGRPTVLFTFKFDSYEQTSFEGNAYMSCNEFGLSGESFTIESGGTFCYSEVVANSKKYKLIRVDK
jgi:hypothetical protein